MVHFPLVHRRKDKKIRFPSFQRTATISSNQTLCTYVCNKYPDSSSCYVILLIKIDDVIYVPKQRDMHKSLFHGDLIVKNNCLRGKLWCLYVNVFIAFMKYYNTSLKYGHSPLRWKKICTYSDINNFLIGILISSFNATKINVNKYNTIDVKPNDKERARRALYSTSIEGSGNCCICWWPRPWPFFVRSPGNSWHFKHTDA